MSRPTSESYSFEYDDNRRPQRHLSMDYASAIHAGAQQIAGKGPSMPPTTVVAGGMHYPASIDEDPMRQALMSGRVRFPPNGWWEDWWFYVRRARTPTTIHHA